MRKGNNFLEFRDEEGWNLYISFPVTNREERQKLRMWVCYERGNREAFYDYRFLYRGFYLYISLETDTETGRSIVDSKYNRRILLGEVIRKSKGAYREFAEKAGWYAREMVEKYCGDLDIDWQNGRACPWSGNENDLGMWREHYRITHYW